MAQFPRWVGLLASWAFFVLAVGLLVYGGVAEAITLSDETKLYRIERIDRMIEDHQEEQLKALQEEMKRSESAVTKLASDVSSAQGVIEDLHDTGLVITVSTAENKVYARREGQLVFEAIASTGSGSTLVEGGRTMVFRTPIGKFRIRSKEEDPVWVPPDWHYIEEARKIGAEAVRLKRGDCIGEVCASGTNVYRNGVPIGNGELIYAGGAVVIPPLGTKPRQFPDVLGTHRLNLGDGYALHGTQMVRQLGRAVSHGCVRLHNDDIARLYSMASVGDEVIIY